MKSIKKRKLNPPNEKINLKSTTPNSSSSSSNTTTPSRQSSSSNINANTLLKTKISTSTSFTSISNKKHKSKSSSPPPPPPPPLASSSSNSNPPLPPPTVLSNVIDYVYILIYYHIFRMIICVISVNVKVNYYVVMVHVKDHFISIAWDLLKYQILNIGIVMNVNPK